MIIISSANELKLSSPSFKESISVGFFLIELARILEKFEDRYDFVFATPDGRRPHLDINGLDLNFHVQGARAPLVQAMSNFRNTNIFYPNSRVRNLLGLDLRSERFRQRRHRELERREREIQTALKYLGNIPFTEVLPNTHPEVVESIDGIKNRFSQRPKKNYLSLREIVEKDRDQEDEFNLSDFSFAFLPGGHGPMVDFINNPYMGEVLNSLSENDILISAICHGPVALQSAQFRVDSEGRPYRVHNSLLSGATLTTVSSFEESLVLALGYPRVPSWQKTDLEYYVDHALIDAGYTVEYGSRMFLGVQAYPGYPNVVYDPSVRLLTGNGPQSMDLLVERLENLL